MGHLWTNVSSLSVKISKNLFCYGQKLLTGQVLIDRYMVIIKRMVHFSKTESFDFNFMNEANGSSALKTARDLPLRVNDIRREIFPIEFEASQPYSPLSEADAVLIVNKPCVMFPPVSSVKSEMECSVSKFHQ